MRRYLYLLLLVDSVAVSCAKDESVPTISRNNSGVLAKDIAGTWTFEPPTAENIVVKGTTAELTDMVKAQLISMMNERIPLYLRLDVTFDGSMYCSGESSVSDPKVRYQGVYLVSGGRLNATLNSPTERLSIYGLLEKGEGASFILNFDEDAYIEHYAQLLKQQQPPGATSDAVKSVLEKMRADITELRCPIKLIKKETE